MGCYLCMYKILFNMYLIPNNRINWGSGCTPEPFYSTLGSLSPTTLPARLAPRALPPVPLGLPRAPLMARVTLRASTIGGICNDPPQVGRPEVKIINNL
ncbi:hypothetical protein LIER_36667 [Lithospermum erythrorhizon]|uniref:Uncharacterized protein n=1 Tax=Lithospermum erythrorhizon TaxID=34254 RepID=A0AAV3P9D0_LITER